MVVRACAASCTGGTGHRVRQNGSEAIHAAAPATASVAQPPPMGGRRAKQHPPSQRCHLCACQLTTAGTCTARSQLSFTGFVYPCLILTYMGQGAYLLDNLEDVTTAYWSFVPDSVAWPMLVLATAATIVASQALISACFSITKQVGAGVRRLPLPAPLVWRWCGRRDLPSPGTGVPRSWAESDRPHTCTPSTFMDCSCWAHVH